MSKNQKPGSQHAPWRLWVTLWRLRVTLIFLVLVIALTVLLALSGLSILSSSFLFLLTAVSTGAALLLSFLQWYHPRSPNGQIPPSSNQEESQAISPRISTSFDLFRQRLVPPVSWLNRRLAPIVNRLNIDWGSLAVLMLGVAFFLIPWTSTSADLLTFVNNLSLIASYLALVVFCSELCVLFVHILAEHQPWRWLGLIGLVVIGVAIYLPHMIFSWEGPSYYIVATAVPFLASLLPFVHSRKQKPAASIPGDYLPK